MECCLVSIIVPAYNVGKYIEKCVMSILRQIYTNIELIIVDDGSTDSTPQIVDELARLDSRIRVIHKQNGGVSVARNIGIEISKGQYIVFVDGDDFISPDYVEYMLSLILSSDSDMAMSNNWFELEGEKQVEKEEVEIISKEEATAMLIGPRVIVYSPNKIFKRSLILDNNLRFSTFLFYGEGMSFLTEAAQLCNSVVVGNRKVYYYRRDNGDSATTTFDIQNFYNGEKALRSVKERLKVHSEKIDTMWLWHMSMFYLGAIVKVKANHSETAYSIDYRRWKSYIRGNYLKLAFVNYIPIYRRLMLLGGCISPWLMAKLDQKRRKYIFNHSVKDSVVL